MGRRAAGTARLRRLRLAVHLNREVVAQNGAAVEHVNRELLRERVRLIAHRDAHTEVAQFGVFGNGARARQGLRQTANHQTQSVLSERDVVGIHRGRTRLLHILRTEYEEVFDLPDSPVHQRAQTRFPAVVKLAEPGNLTHR